MSQNGHLLPSSSGRRVWESFDSFLNKIEQFSFHLEENEVLIDKAKQVMSMIRTVLKQNSIANTSVNDFRLKNQGKDKICKHELFHD